MKLSIFTDIGRNKEKKLALSEYLKIASNNTNRERKSIGAFLVVWEKPSSDNGHGNVHSFSNLSPTLDTPLSDDDDDEDTEDLVEDNIESDNEKEQREKQETNHTQNLIDFICGRDPDGDETLLAPAMDEEEEEEKEDSDLVHEDEFINESVEESKNSMLETWRDTANTFIVNMF